MANECTRCGQKIGGFMGVSEASETAVSHWKEQGLNFVTPICVSCLRSMGNEPEEQKKEEERLAELTLHASISLATFNPYPQKDYENLGVVSAHIALGTGILTTLFSNATDIMGKQSQTYNKKMREAEEACTFMLKKNALAIGATEVIGLHTTYTELTMGHGQLLVCMSGTAIKR